MKNTRDILLFGSVKNKLLREQQGILESQPLENEDRNIRIVYANDSEELLSRYATAKEEFALIVLGRDGNEKMRSKSVVPASTIFSLIDSMPMRQNEIKQIL